MKAGMTIILVLDEGGGVHTINTISGNHGILLIEASGLF